MLRCINPAEVSYNVVVGDSITLHLNILHDNMLPIVSAAGPSFRDIRAIPSRRGMC